MIKWGSLNKKNKLQMFVTYNFNHFHSRILIFQFIDISVGIGIIQNKDTCFIIYQMFANNLHFIECLNVRDIIEISVTLDIQLISIPRIVNMFSNF